MFVYRPRLFFDPPEDFLLLPLRFEEDLDDDLPLLDFGLLFLVPEDLPPDDFAPADFVPLLFELLPFAPRELLPDFELPEDFPPEPLRDFEPDDFELPLELADDLLPLDLLPRAELLEPLDFFEPEDLLPDDLLPPADFLAPEDFEPDEDLLPDFDPDDLELLLEPPPLLFLPDDLPLRPTARVAAEATWLAARFAAATF